MMEKMFSAVPSVKEISASDLNEAYVLLRADLDLPIVEGRIADDFRLRALIPTLEYLYQTRSRIILLGHRGRPGGKTNLSLTLAPVIKHLKTLLPQISFWQNIDSWQAKDLEEGRKNLPPQGILVYPNLRFHPGEESNDPQFAALLAQGGNFYINESFATSHRAHASLVGLPRLLPGALGLRWKKELEILKEVREKPARPLIFIVGGAKKSKLDFVKNISSWADQILLGGKLAFAQELEGVPKVRFPVDARRIDDIGPRSEKLFQQYLQKAALVVWAGPLGRWEEEKFRQGTAAIARFLLQNKIKTIVGGGDTLAALKTLGLREQFYFCSTGGGAMLEYLAHGDLVALAALRAKKK